MESFFDKRKAGGFGQSERLTGHPGLGVMQDPGDGRHCVNRVSGRKGHVLVYENHSGTASRSNLRATKLRAFGTPPMIRRSRKVGPDAANQTRPDRPPHTAEPA